MMGKILLSAQASQKKASNMDIQEYEAAANSTCSNQFHGDKVPMRVLYARFNDFAIKAEALDEVKKSLFYGKPNSFVFINKSGPTHLQVQWDDPDCMGVEPDAYKILHGVLGIATEAGELVEGILKGGGNIDKTNMLEEVGDLLWYVAILVDALGMGIEEAMMVNINKLRKRFPEGFTEHHALNRDLDAERAVLENGVATTTKAQDQL